MGRGSGDAASSILYGGSNPLPRSTTRTLKRGFVSDKEEWKKQETEYINEVIAQLEAATKDFASSDEGWCNYLRTYASIPNYAPNNVLWARSQLSWRGITDDGLIFSESAWKALGRRIKAEYCRPEARRDRRYGYDRERDWDDKYAVEMTQPLGHRGFYKTLTDSNGDPILDSDGNEQKVFIPLEPKGFKAFIAYHEDATEALDGGDPPPLPSAPWAEAEGSEEDAGRLLDDLVEKICPGEGLEIRFGTPLEQGQTQNVGGPVARLLRSENTIIIDPSAPKSAQATEVLREMFVALGDRRNSKDTDESRRRHRAAAESAKYVIASLYGLDSEEQTFPHLAEIAEEEKGLRKLSSEIHGHVSTVLNYLDPKTRALTHSREASRKSRAEKYRKQKSKKGGKKAARRSKAAKAAQASA